MTDTTAAPAPSAVPTPVTPAAPAVLDLSAFQPEQSGTLMILDPSGVKETGWVWTFGSPSHPKAQSYMEKIGREQTRREALVEAARANGRKVKPDDKDLDDKKKSNADWVVSRTLGWAPAVTIPTISPDPLTFSDENVAKVVSHPDGWWVLSQVVEFLAHEKSFTKGSASK